MAKGIRSLRDVEDVETLFLKLLVIGERRSARKGQVHIIQISPQQRYQVIASCTIMECR